MYTQLVSAIIHLLFNACFVLSCTSLGTIFKTVCYSSTFFFPMASRIRNQIINKTTHSLAMLPYYRCFCGLNYWRYKSHCQCTHSYSLTMQSAIFFLEESLHHSISTEANILYRLRNQSISISRKTERQSIATGNSHYE